MKYEKGLFYLWPNLLKIIICNWPENIQVYVLFTDSAKADITFPNVVKLLLIFAPSFNRVPFAPVDSARSDPARSTRDILLT